MIEPADEMLDVQRRAYADAVARGVHPVLAEREGLAAVLTIVERDHPVLCGAARPLDDSGYGEFACTLAVGHDGEHQHRDWGDWSISWGAP